MARQKRADQEADRRLAHAALGADDRERVGSPGARLAADTPLQRSFLALTG
jgi:hypothetical protein